MRLSEIGEFGLIRLLAREFGIQYPPERGARPARGLVLGLGDDAVVTSRRDGALIWTTDTMVAGEHFLPDRSSWRDTGWKALAANLSDIAAMGGSPHLALVTLSLPDDTCVDDVIELYRGLHECATAFDVTLGGGDIVRSPVFSVTVALSGWAHLSPLGEPAVLRRDTARPGDVVAVTGRLGASAGGLRLLTGGAGFESDAEKHLRAAHERPMPRVALGQAAVAAGLRCGMDISDGLVQDLGHIARASRVAIRVDAARVPVDDDLCALLSETALILALTGGEDYELALIGPLSPVQQLAAVADPPLTVIGEVTAAAPGVSVIDETGKEMHLDKAGWDHFPTP